MAQFWIIKENLAAEFLIEEESFKGVQLVGETVAEDIKMVCGNIPVQTKKLENCESNRVVLMGTVDNSMLLSRLESENRISLEGIRGKRESFLMQIIEKPFPERSEIEQLLVIAGSDKRGTIYGMFRLSEICGVSPLVYFGDAIPVQQAQVCVTLQAPYISKEPSIKYRGFFINDEWPAFGSWCTEKFGDVNAKAYKNVFELLLRLKGNYMWPAMWNSSFSEDGPGLLNAELADTYGVIMGLSHHEPMCRSGVEWQRKYKEYGTDSTWSFVSNAEAITKFWEDGIVRNKPFENVITIGMRGESDSKLLPENATLKDNIDVVKKAILAQHELLRKNFSKDLLGVPRMLAIYKEVEDYYYGDDTCEGMKDWKELSDVIFLLSDDNHGNLRTLPTEETRNHQGGYGMYYHFDYHGSPISYEWMNCNRLTKTWEQMTQAYESGVREMWIVNVGDLKAVEYPLCYFMELAYDYETWGSNAPNKTEFFVKEWVDKQFGNRLTEEQKGMVANVLEGYTKWNAIRTPEAMREGIYHPVHFLESERIWKEIKSVMNQAEILNNSLTEEALITYQSMIYYPAVASMNLILMYLEAGMNKELAKRGCLYANVYAERVKERIYDDSRYVKEFHQMNNGKWNHCMSSAHTGFRGWDAYDWAYPTLETVVPIPEGKVLVSFRGSEQYHLGAHWQYNAPLINNDFTRPDRKEVLLDLDSRGNVSYSFEVKFDSEWLLCSDNCGRVELNEGGRKTLQFSVNRDFIRGNVETQIEIMITFDNGNKTDVKLQIQAEELKLSKQENVSYLFVENQGYCCILAEHYNEKKDVNGKGFQLINYLGREGAALKAFPAMDSYPEGLNAPYVGYSFLAERSGLYHVDIYILSRNPANKGGRMKFAISANDGEPKSVYSVSEQYYTEWIHKEWFDGVLEHARIVTVEIPVQEGQNNIYLYAGEPGVIFEKLVLHPADNKMLESYLGPTESYYI